jgi:hypothetical protein
VDNIIIIGPKEKGFQIMDWIHVASDRIKSWSH